MERARIYVTRGMSRRLIRIKCKLSDAEFDELQKWARKIASRRR